jgi:hypothetical protein
MPGPREPIELNISPGKVFFIATRAKEFDAKAGADTGEETGATAKRRSRRSSPRIPEQRSSAARSTSSPTRR